MFESYLTEASLDEYIRAKQQEIGWLTASLDAALAEKVRRAKRRKEIEEHWARHLEAHRQQVQKWKIEHED